MLWGLRPTDKGKECRFSVACHSCEENLFHLANYSYFSCYISLKKGVKEFSHLISQERILTAVEDGKLAGSLWLDLSFKKTRDKGYNTWNLFMR